MTEDRVPHPRTYSLVGGGGLDMFLVTDDESGINIGYAREVGGPLTAPMQAAPDPKPDENTTTVRRPRKRFGSVGRWHRSEVARDD